MLDIMNKYKQYQQPVHRTVNTPIQRTVQKQQPKKQIKQQIKQQPKKVENNDPYNLNFLNGKNLYQNYKNPFNF